MNKELKNVAAVEKKRESYTLINEKEKNKIYKRDICTNVSNCGVQLKNETDNKTGRPKDAQPLQIPTQKNINVGADASVRLKKEDNQNKYKIKIFNKIKSNVVCDDEINNLQNNPNKYNIKTINKIKLDVVGGGVPDDPKRKLKYTNKSMSNIPTSNIKRPTSNSAITLIALIITIIVLLILAGVTLNMVIGDSGIFNKANQAKNKTEVAQYEEELRMCILELQTDSATNGTTFNMETIKNKLVEKVKKLENTEDIEFPTEESETRLEGTYKGYEFYVDDKYVAHIGDKATGIRLTTSLNPSGWTNQNVTATITIKSNNGINKVEPDEGTKNGSNEYVITKTNITENTSFKYTVTDEQGNTQEKTAIINTIDKEPPADFTITAENTENGLQINNATIDSGSGIEKYEYYAKKSTDGDYTKYESNPIIGLTSGTYDIKVIAYDKAGNTKESVLNSFKVEKAIKRTNISAADIKNNPEGYYGQEVNYTSANGQNDWKIFHSDGTNIYLITGNYVKVTDNNGNIDESKLNPNTKMQIASGGQDYRVNWKNNLPTFSTDVSNDIISKFKINTSIYNINSHKDKSNAQCVSALLNSNLWSSYIDSSKGNNQTAIGGPTVQLWMDSWNARYQNSSDQLYCNSSNENGYYVGSSLNPTATIVETKDKREEGGELYFANNYSSLKDGKNTVDSYWISSPSADGSYLIYYVDLNCYVRTDGYEGFTYDKSGIRPVVCLKSNISLK